MTPDQDCSTYFIDDKLLLRFLITRFTEMLGEDISNLSPVWTGLGLVGLHQNKQLQSAFQILISSASYTDKEILNFSIDFFLVESDRLDSLDSTAEFEARKIERRPLSPRTRRKFLYWCWREGRKMEGEAIFEFYPIWELLLGMALPSDEEIQQEFEKTCRFSSLTPKEKIEVGLDFVKKSVFKRRGKTDNASQDN